MNIIVTQEFLTGFIELYRTKPCLWKLKSDDYTNRIKKDKAYKEMVDYCRITHPTLDIGFVKNKINNIRSRYRKELTKINKSIMAGKPRNEVYVPKLWYFGLLDFLREEDGLNFTRYSNLTLQPTTEDDVDEQSLASSITEDEVRETDNEQKPDITEQQQLLNSNQKRLRVEQNLASHETNLSATEDRVIYREREQDEFDALGLALSKKLRKMNRLQQLFAENLINKVLFLGSLNQLNINSDITPIDSFDINLYQSTFALNEES